MHTYTHIYTYVCICIYIYNLGCCTSIVQALWIQLTNSACFLNKLPATCKDILYISFLPFLTEVSFMGNKSCLFAFVDGHFSSTYFIYISFRTAWCLLAWSNLVSCPKNKQQTLATWKSHSLGTFMVYSLTAKMTDHKNNSSSCRSKIYCRMRMLLQKACAHTHRSGVSYLQDSWCLSQLQSISSHIQQKCHHKQPNNSSQT